MNRNPDLPSDVVAEMRRLRDEAKHWQSTADRLAYGKGAGKGSKGKGKDKGGKPKGDKNRGHQSGRQDRERSPRRYR